MLLSPLEKGCGPLFEQTKILSNKDFGQNCYSGFRREDENVKSYQTHRWTNGRQAIEKLTQAFSSGEPKTGLLQI